MIAEGDGKFSSGTEFSGSTSGIGIERGRLWRWGLWSGFELTMGMGWCISNPGGWKSLANAHPETSGHPGYVTYNLNRGRAESRSPGGRKIR